MADTNTNTNTNVNTNTNTAPQAPFADANGARTFLGDFVHDPSFLSSVKDDQVVPWATKVHGRVAELGKQWPTSWRELVAGEDKGQMKNLEKFASVPALYQSYNALQQRIGSGELRPVSAFPEKGTDAEKSAWRQLNGVPEKPEDYKFTVPQGVELDDDDKAVLQGMQKYAHAKNIPQAHTAELANWFLTEQDTRIQERVKKDAQFRIDSEDKLRSEWQSDYRENLNRIGALLDSGPKGFREAFSMARLPDGTKLGDNADALRFLVDIARERMPAGIRIPSGQGNLSQGVEAEIAEIEKKMRTNRSEYNKDEKLQARYRELVTAREQLKARKAA